MYGDEFIDSVPVKYDGVIDLSVCKPVEIASVLKDKRRMAVVKSSNKSISFIYWLYFYGVAFDIILKEKVHFYSNALELAISKITSK